MLRSTLYAATVVRKYWVCALGAPARVFTCLAQVSIMSTIKTLMAVGWTRIDFLNCEAIWVQKEKKSHPIRCKNKHVLTNFVQLRSNLNYVHETGQCKKKKHAWNPPPPSLTERLPFCPPFPPSCFSSILYMQEMRCLHWPMEKEGMATSASSRKMTWNLMVSSQGRKKRARCLPPICTRALLYQARWISNIPTIHHSTTTWARGCMPRKHIHPQGATSFRNRFCLFVFCFLNEALLFLLISNHLRNYKVLPEYFMWMSSAKSA